MLQCLIYAAYGILGVVRCRSWGVCVLVACCTATATLINAQLHQVGKLIHKSSEVCPENDTALTAISITVKLHTNVSVINIVGLKISAINCISGMCPLISLDIYRIVKF